MAVKNYDYSVPGDYTYDTNKILVSGGSVTLKENLANIYARWHLNESSGTNVPDTGILGTRNGTMVNMEDGDWVSGHLNNCLSFDGSNEYINCGAIANFERTNSFSFEGWFKTSINSKILISKRASGGSPNPGYQISLSSLGKLRVLLSATSLAFLQVDSTTASLNDNAWHHFVVTYDGSSDVSGVRIYIDNNNETLQVLSNALSGTILNGIDFQISGRNGVNSIFNGLIDEVVIYDRVITVTEVAYRYNSGTGRENWIYYSDSPIIEPTVLFDPASVNTWDSFLETLGGSNEGSIGYNLYKADKVNKYYWNGSAWVTGGSSSNYNTVATINTNIGSFDVSPDKIGYIAYLISDSLQQVELTENQFTFTENQMPLVNAGSNKTAIKNQTIKPFSDASFSDPDGGDIIKAEYKVDGEVDIWTEIPQGAYGSLIEAVQAFTYQYQNLGSLVTRLRATDDELSTADDFLTVTVALTSVSFQIFDITTGLDIASLSFTPGDSGSSETVNSPFTHDYSLGTFTIDVVKTDFVSLEEDITISSSGQTFIIGMTPTSIQNLILPLSLKILNKREFKLNLKRVK